MRQVRRQAKLMWGLSAVVILGAIVIGAAIMIPQVLQQNRIVAYTDAVQHTNAAFTTINEAEIEKGRATVLVAFQIEEAEQLQRNMSDLSELSEDYFSLETVAALATASDILNTELGGLTLDDAEREFVADASRLIESHGYMWQTDFLNLDTTALEELVESPEAERVVVVSDGDVTPEILEEAFAVREEVDARLASAEQALSAAQQRVESLRTAVEASLVPLVAAASEAPGQAEVVLEMYPRLKTR